MVIILVDCGVIAQVGKRADPDFLQKVYNIVEVRQDGHGKNPLTLEGHQSSNGGLTFLPWLCDARFQYRGWGLSMGNRHNTAGARHANADGSAQRLSLRAQVTLGVEESGRRQGQQKGFDLMSKMTLSKMILL